LLEALTDLISNFDEYGGDDSDFPLIAKARIVISKATQ
jgi:hypothetical protein